jgi:hypothetical protein
MLENDGGWDDIACSVDTAIAFLWGHIPDNPKLTHFRDVLNKDPIVREAVIELDRQRHERWEQLYKDYTAMMQDRDRWLMKCMRK